MLSITLVPLALRAAMSRAMPARMSGGSHVVGLQQELMVVAYYNSPVRIAQNDLRAHFNEIVDEIQTALKHFLMHQYAAAALCGHNEHYAQ